MKHKSPHIACKSHGALSTGVGSSLLLSSCGVSYTMAGIEQSNSFVRHTASDSEPERRRGGDEENEQERGRDRQRKREREREGKKGAMVGRGLLAHAVVAACMFFTESLLVPAFTAFNPVKLRSPKTRPVRGTTPAASCTIAVLNASHRRNSNIHRNSMIHCFDHSWSRLCAGTTKSSPRTQRYNRQLYASSSTRMPANDAVAGATAAEGCDRLEFLKTAARRAAMIGASGIAASAGLAVAGDGSGRPQAAGAFCGEPYPYWAYFTDFDEVFVPFDYEGYKGKLWIRTVGNEKDQKKVRAMNKFVSFLFTAGGARVHGTLKHFSFFRLEKATSSPSWCYNCVLTRFWRRRAITPLSLVMPPGSRQTKWDIRYMYRTHALETSLG